MQALLFLLTEPEAPQARKRLLGEAGVYIADSTQHIVDILLQLKAEGKI